ncbi:MAG: DUF3754 domain-containing protein [Desulfobacterales bacterium]|nr:MAG: DUF3754 domain-containing protein [Desulfobacterales bacterium]
MSMTTGTQRFIRLRKRDVLALCLADAALNTADQERLQQLGHLLQALLHYQFQQRLERLKESYAPYDPDADTRSQVPLSAQERERCQKALVSELTALLDAANYEAITDHDLREALAEESLFKIRLEVDFDDFEEVLFFRRGASIRQETLLTLWGLRKRPIAFTNYARVVVFLKFKEADYFAKSKRKQLNFVPGATLIKLFHNVPKADLEMLFPNSRIRMKTIDKLIIGVPAAVSGIIMLVTKLGATFILLGSLISFWFGFSSSPVEVEKKHLVILGAGLGTLAGFLFKQFNKFKNRKLRFMQALTENLYFKNLDNNAGVFHHLIDDAEEEEFKEVWLAYFCLLTADRPLTRQQLDQTAEAWLAHKAGVRIDFEISDALDKLKRLQLVQIESGAVHPVPLPQALNTLDRQWDALFGFHHPPAAGRS